MTARCILIARCADGTPALEFRWLDTPLRVTRAALDRRSFVVNLARNEKNFSERFKKTRMAARLLDDAEPTCAFGQCDQREIGRQRNEFLRDAGRRKKM
jgi:hypothetical protein